MIGERVFAAARLRNRLLLNMQPAARDGVLLRSRYYYPNSMLQLLKYPYPN